MQVAFGLDHRALAIDRWPGEHHAVGHVAQPLHRHLALVGGHGGQVELVDRLAEAGGSVAVPAEGDAQRREGQRQLIVGERPGAVEGHVLHEVGGAALVIGLVVAADVEAQAKRKRALRAGAVLHGVAQPVRQAPIADGGVRGQQRGVRPRP